MSSVEVLYCRKCEKEQKHIQVSVEKRVQHLAHAIATALTFGFWLLVWIYYMIDSKKGLEWKCSICGTMLS
jgi:hypothetical protein